MNMWDNIPIDIFFRICDRLTYLDTIVASGVSKSWQSSVSVFLQGISQISPKAPWLMLAEEEDKCGRSNSNTMRRFFDLSSGKILNLNLPDTVNRRCVGVGFGWLLTIDIDLQINLLHPLTGRQINLPPYFTFTRDNLFCEFDGIYEVLLLKAVASADPWNYKTQNFNQNCVITAIYDTGTAAIAKLGDKAWTDIRMPNQCLSYDAIFYESQIYIQGRDLYTCNFDGHQVPFANPIARNPEDLRVCKCYLVASDDEVLLVCRKYENVFGKASPNTDEEITEEEITDDQITDEEITEEEITNEQITDEEITEEEITNEQIMKYATVSFQVYKLRKKNEVYKLGKKKKIRGDDFECEYVKVKTLDNQALFIGDSASFSVCATRMNGCRSDCIYFTDDLFDFRSGTKNGGGFDMGVYNLRDGTIEQHYKGESLSYYSTPFWYI